MIHAQICAGADHPEKQHLGEVLRVTSAQAHAGVDHLVKLLLGEVVGLTHGQVCAGAGHPVSGRNVEHLHADVVGVRPAQACAGAGHLHAAEGAGVKFDNWILSQASVLTVTFASLHKKHL